MTDVLEATHVAPKTTTDVFVVMNRYGDDYWSACTTWKTLEDAQRSVGVDATIQAWKIVKVPGLPVSVHDGEAETPNAEVSGPEAALSPEGRARLPGCADRNYEERNDHV